MGVLSEITDDLVRRNAAAERLADRLSRDDPDDQVGEPVDEFGEETE